MSALASRGHCCVRLSYMTPSDRLEAGHVHRYPSWRSRSRAHGHDTTTRSPEDGSAAPAHEAKLTADRSAAAVDVSRRVHAVGRVALPLFQRVIAHPPRSCSPGQPDSSMDPRVHVQTPPCPGNFTSMPHGGGRSKIRAHGMPFTAQGTPGAAAFFGSVNRIHHPSPRRRQREQST